MKLPRTNGPLARLFSLFIVMACAACASAPSSDTIMLRPGPQRLPTLRAQGDLVIATLPGATVTAEPLTGKDLEVYYARRSAPVNPFTRHPKETKGLMAFVLRIQNLGRDRITFEPAQSFLTDQQNRRSATLTYDELYTLLGEKGEPAITLRALEETVLTNLLVVPPKLEREGLLIFPPPDSDAKTVILEVGSLYIGSTEQLLLFEFEVRHPR